MEETTMEESLKSKIRNIYYTGLAQGLHEVDGFDTFASSWYEELVTLFQETIEQTMPEKRTCRGTDIRCLESQSKCSESGGYNIALEEVKSNLLKAIGPIKTRLVKQV